jgi:hypothetical protein
MFHLTKDMSTLIKSIYIRINLKIYCYMNILSYALLLNSILIEFNRLTRIQLDTKLKTYNLIL